MRFVLAVACTCLLFLAGCKKPYPPVGHMSPEMEHAINTGDTLYVQRQLDLRLVNPNDVEDSVQAFSGLTYAAMNGNLKMTKLLVEAGANVNYQAPPRGRVTDLTSQPLYQSIHFPEVHDYLVTHGAIVRPEDAGDYRRAEAARKH